MKLRLRPNIVAALVAACTVAPLWMVFDREPPYEVVSGTIEPPYPTPGSKISVSWEVHPVRSCPATPDQKVTRTITDAKGVKHEYAAVEAVYGHGNQGHPDIRRTVELPASIPPGPARYAAVACYTCNPVQDLFPGLLSICVQLPEIPFVVAAPPP